MAKPKIFAILTIVVVLVAIYFLFFSGSNEFDQGYSEIKSIWASHGVEIDKIDFDEDKTITVLQPYELVEIKNQLASKRASLRGSSDSTKALRMLIDIHANNVEFLSMYNEFYTKSASLEIDTTDYVSFCQVARNDYDELVKSGDEQLALLNENNSLISEFNSKYSKAFDVSARNLDFDVSDMEKQIVEFKSVGGSFDEICA